MTEEEKHPTNQLAALVSLGIVDHFPKFYKMKGTLHTYLWFLFYAKHAGPERGTFHFTAQELGQVLSTGKSKIINRSTVIRIIHHLERIGMIKITKQSKTRHDPIWGIKLTKYKDAWADFRGIHRMDTKATVAELQREPESIVAESQRYEGPKDPVTTPLSTDQLHLFDSKFESQRSPKDDGSTLQPCNDEISRNFNVDEMLNLPNPKIALYFATIYKTYSNNIYRFFEEESKSNKRDKNIIRLMKLLKNEKLAEMSSEEIVDPKAALAVTKYLHDAHKSPRFNGTTHALCLRARNEFVRLYWNGLTLDRFLVFPRASFLTEKRIRMMTKMFGRRDEVFLKYWALSMVRIKNSKYCRGELPASKGWKANFDWFIKKENPVVNAMEGQYDDWSNTQKISQAREERRKPRDYLVGVPLTSVFPEDIPDWVKANPEAARKARAEDLL